MDYNYLFMLYCIALNYFSEFDELDWSLVKESLLLIYSPEAHFDFIDCYFYKNFDGF